MEYVLVIGSMLLDMGGHSTTPEIQQNKIGTLSIRMGGVAYNVAANLSAKGIETILVTCLKSDSFSLSIMRSVLRNTNINDKYIIEKAGIAEPGYVYITEDGKDLLAGVTSSPIEGLNLTEDVPALNDLIREAKLVVIDTNLVEDQIEYICKMCREAHKPMFVNIVSDAKAKRVYHKTYCTPFEIVTLNGVEARELGIDLTNLSKENAQKICQSLNSKWVFVTLGHKGYIILNQSGIFEKVPIEGIEIGPNQSTVGSGDAFFSSLCFSYLKGKDLDGNETRNHIRGFVYDVLSKSITNMGPSIEQMVDQKMFDIYRDHEPSIDNREDISSIINMIASSQAESYLKKIKIFSVTASVLVVGLISIYLLAESLPIWSYIIAPIVCILGWLGINPVGNRKRWYRGMLEKKKGQYSKKLLNQCGVTAQVENQKAING